jgi:hypothetical protein
MRNCRKHTNTKRFNNKLFNNQWVLEEIGGEIENFLDQMK